MQRVMEMDVTCSNCATVSSIEDRKVPIGKSYFLCPNCDTRINIFKGLQPGALVVNLVGVRFFHEGNEFHEEYCEPGELWRVEKVTQPCPDRGEDRECEINNKGRCPNQRLLLRLERDKKLYKPCLYRNGRRIFDKTSRTPVGSHPLFNYAEDDETYRIR
jgi:hypothetical protein